MKIFTRSSLYSGLHLLSYCCVYGYIHKSARTVPMGKALTLLILNKQSITCNTVPDDVYSLENQLAEPVKVPIERRLVQLVSQVIRTSEGSNQNCQATAACPAHS